MTKWFNTAGPCKPDIHYTLPTSERLPQLKRLIDQQNYFVIHAPRQTGKTTAMLTLAQELTASGKYTAMLLSLEVDAVFPHDPLAAQNSILNHWQNQLRFLKLPLPHINQIKEETGIAQLDLQTVLSIWAASSPHPLVVFLDEIDALGVIEPEWLSPSGELIPEKLLDLFLEDVCQVMISVSNII